MTKQRYFFLILILGTLTALGPFSIDMYLPGFQAIAADLNTDVAKVSLSLSSFFIGISFGQLLYGPLLDKYGRKKPLYFGLIVYILSSIACVFVTSIDVLIALRFIQAIGCCAAAVTSLAMVRDLFEVKDSAKVLSLLVLVLSVSPIVAPTVGGYVASAFGWHSIFIILAAICTTILATVYFTLPETGKYNPDISLRPKPIVKNFLAVLKEPQFYTYSFTGAVAFSGLFSYIAGSPTLFMEIYKVNEKQYGWIFALLSIGIIGASQVNSLVLKKYKSEQIILAALSSMLVVGLLFFAGSLLGWLTLESTIVFIFLYLACLGFTFPNSTALSLAPFTTNVGSASSLTGAIQMALGSITSIAVSVLNNKTAVPMTGVMAAGALLALSILLTGRKILKNNEVNKSEPAI